MTGYSDGQCPWKRGSKRQRFYRPDWGRSPDCHGCADCDGLSHTCHQFGLAGFCEWPGGLALDQWEEAFWRPGQQAWFVEGWLAKSNRPRRRPEAEIDQ